MAHGVKTDHVGGAESAGTGASEFLAGEIIHHVITQAKVFHFFHGGQHAGDTDPVGDEVGGVLGAHHPFAQGAGDEGFQIVKNLWQRGGRVDQLNQLHVAWRVEEVDAAKTRFDFFRQDLAQLGDGKPRGVGGHDGVRCHERRNFFVQVELPVHALGDGLDDEVTVAQLLHVFLIIGLPDQGRIFGYAQR
ncbi:hypothetical protein GALL_484430 [mine drainage metagenome]|uniref:Uncharacterized protein n=1 Tax=mine drainage metagenome TaxID=410659 RepID=A0A1J5Q254_9ZZZZ